MSLNNQDPARYAAEEIMGYEWADTTKFDDDGDPLAMYQYTGWWCPKTKKCIHIWKPLDDSNQLDLIEMELVKLGFYFEYGYKDYYWIGITHSKNNDISIYESFSDGTQIRQARLNAMVEAVRKFKEMV